MTVDADWGTSLLFAGIALLEGIARVPAGAVVLRTMGRGAWRPVSVRPGLRLVSWWAPASLTLVLRPMPEPARPVSAENPLIRLGGWPAILDALGGFTLAGLVVGLPLAARWWSGWGFLVGLAVVFFLAAVTAAATAIALGRTGAAGVARLRFGLRCLNPFAAGRAGEALRERALGQLPPLEAARHLLEPGLFAEWLRPRVYDRLIAPRTSDPELDRLLSVEAQSALLAARPAGAGPGEPWCSRCGSLFQPTVHTCPECGVGLERALAA